MSVCREQSSKESNEADHDNPVSNSRTGEIEHLGMAKNFAKHVGKARTAVAAASWVGLPRLVDGDQLSGSDDH